MKTPKEIVEILDDYIIGQKNAKKTIAIALRNRWRRLKLDEEMRNEVMPKNILMIGSTGVGKTEIARRLSKMFGLPFVKVEASKYTEVGFVGRDVESMVRDLASGKTTLVREIVKKHGKNWKNVSSPTFSIMQNYGEIYHYDIYNAGINGILKNGLFENFFAPGLHLIEWGDENLMKYLQNFGLEFCIVQISVKEQITKISAKIITDTNSHKQILIGKGGETIKRIGIKSRKRISDFSKVKIHSNLQIFVKTGWKNDENLVKSVFVY